MRARTNSRSRHFRRRSAARRCAAAQARPRREQAHRGPDRRRCGRRARRCSRSRPACRARPRAPTRRVAGEPFGDSVFGDLDGRVEFTRGARALTPSLDRPSGARRAAARRGRDRDRGCRRHARGRPRERTTGAARATRRARRARAVRARRTRDAQRCCRARGSRCVTGRIGLQAEFEGERAQPRIAGRSLKGTGTITLEDAQISGLDPKAFNAAIRAADQGLRSTRAKHPRHRRDRARRRPRSRCRGSMPPFTINAGQARIGPHHRARAGRRSRTRGERRSCRCLARRAAHA